jgi:hypothetical protein
VTDIEKATLAQEWLMAYLDEEFEFLVWIPLDKCLELIRFIDNPPDENEQARQLEEDLRGFQTEQIKGLG